MFIWLANTTTSPLRLLEEYYITRLEILGVDRQALLRYRETKPGRELGK